MKKTEYTCDKCGGGISIYGTGWLQDSSLIMVRVDMPVENNTGDTYHLHHHCYREMLEWMKSGSEHANSG